MTGLLFALLSGFSFSLSNILVRTGMHRSGESYTILPIFAFTGTVFFLFPMLILGQASNLASISWLGAGALGGAGIIHFILGRMTGYKGIQLIGANRAVPIFSGSILVAAILGIVLLGEPFTLPLTIAILLTIGGIILIGTAGNSSEKSGLPPGILVKGVLAALGGAACWGITPMLIKIGLREVSSPLLATFVSYASAATLTGISLFSPSNRGRFRQLKRTALIPIVIGAVAVAVGQVLRYSALLYSPVSLVEPLTAGASNLLVFPLSFLLNRQIETFNLRIIAGAIAIVAGVFLLFWAG